MAWSIRFLHPDDYPAVAACFRAAMPDNDDTAESLLDEDESSTAHHRWVAVTDGKVVGTASWFQLPTRLHPQKFWMDGAVHPDWQRRGIGTALYETVVADIRERDAISLRTVTREDCASARHFLERRGFREVRRTWESILDLAQFDFSAWSRQAAAAEVQGIRLLALSELQHLPDWEQRLLTLNNAIHTDVPDFDPSVPLTLEQFRESYLNSAFFLPAGHFIALDGDRWIGLSTLWLGSEEGAMDTGLTGVLPAYRHRGVAMSLKLKGLAWARAKGAVRIRTSNAATNKGMLAINEKLGFARRPAWIHLLHTFEQ